MQKVAKSLPLNNTLRLSKFRTPQGVILDSGTKRFYMNDILKYKSKMPAPDQYLTHKLKPKPKKNPDESE